MAPPGRVRPLRLATDKTSRPSGGDRKLSAILRECFGKVTPRCVSGVTFDADSIGTRNTNSARYSTVATVMSDLPELGNPLVCYAT